MKVMLDGIMPGVVVEVFTKEGFPTISVVRGGNEFIVTVKEEDCCIIVFPAQSLATTLRTQVPVDNCDAATVEPLTAGTVDPVTSD